MKITWQGAGTVLLESGAEKIMFDPFIQMPGGEHPTDLSVFAVPKNVFITHGRLAHLSSVPELISTTDMLVHCDQDAATTLIKMGVSMKQIRSIHQGDIIPVGEMQIKPLKGKFVGFGPFMILKTVVNPRIIKYSHNIPRWIKLHRKFSKSHNAFAYEVKVEGRVVLVLGSIALDERTNYPKDIDVLVLPYQGSGSLTRKGTNIIRKLKPKLVVLSHFDDSCPPISKSINPKKFRLRIKRRIPELQVITPCVGVPIDLSEELKKLEDAKNVAVSEPKEGEEHEV